MLFNFAVKLYYVVKHYCVVELYCVVKFYHVIKFYCVVELYCVIENLVGRRKEKKITSCLFCFKTRDAR
jgi:hypothetical protein